MIGGSYRASLMLHRK